MRHQPSRISRWTMLSSRWPSLLSSARALAQAIFSSCLLRSAVQAAQSSLSPATSTATRRPEEPAAQARRRRRAVEYKYICFIIHHNNRLIKGNTSQVSCLFEHNYLNKLSLYKNLSIRELIHIDERVYGIQQYIIVYRRVGFLG